MCVCVWWGVPVIGNELLSFQQTSICVCTCVGVGLDGWAVLHGWGTYQNGWRAESAWLSHCCNQACPPSVQRTRSSLDLKALNSEVAHCGFWSRFLTFYHEPVLLGFETKPTVLQNWVLVLARFLLAVCCCCLLCLFVLSTWQNPGYSRKKNWYRGKKKILLPWDGPVGKSIRCFLAWFVLGVGGASPLWTVQPLGRKTD